MSPVQDVISILGKEVAFAADTEGSATLVYQWFRNGLPLKDDGRISGTTDAFLKLGDVQESDGGAYSVLVTNAFGQAMSSNAFLTLVLPGTPVEQGSLDGRAVFQAVSGRMPAMLTWLLEAGDCELSTSPIHTFR